MMMTATQPSKAETALRSRPLTAWFGVALLYGALGLGLTWPLATQLRSGIPLGTERVATVPLFNLWTLAWNAESVPRLYSDYWEAPIFHPTPGAFALSEPQPLTGGLAALLAWASGSIVTAYNLILLLALTLNAWLMAWLLRGAKLGWVAALAGGGAALTLPFVHQELGVLQLVPLAGVLFLAGSVWRLGERPSLRLGLGLGAAWIVAYGLSAQVAVFAVLALGPATLWLWRHRLRDRQLWRAVAAAGLLATLFTAPIALAQARSTVDQDLARSLETVRKQSAEPSDYLASAWPSWLPTPDVAERPSARAFWPGTLKVLLASTALVLCFFPSRHRRLSIAAAIVLGTALLLSFGARIEIADLSIASLLRTLPGMEQIRSFFRFALFVQLAVVVLSAIALDLAVRRLQKHQQRLAPVLGLALALVLTLEVRPAAGEIQPLPPLDHELPWLEFILESTSPTDVFAFMPFPEGRSVRDYQGTAQWMYWQIRHWRPMVNGYSGFFPASFRQLKEDVQSFPTQKALQALHRAGVDYLVVHRTLIEKTRPPEDGALHLNAVFRDQEHGLAIFALEESP